MATLVEGLGLIVITMIFIGFLSRLISAGRGGSFIQAEMFTGLFSVVLVAILATGTALVWFGGFQIFQNMFYTTYLTIGILVVLMTIAAKLPKVLKAKSA